MTGGTSPEETAPPRGDSAARRYGAENACRRRALLVASAALTAAAGVLLAVGVARQEPAPPQAAPAPPPSANSSVRGGPPPSGHAHHNPTRSPGGRQVLPASSPELLSIPAIGVRSSLERLGLDARRAMETPQDPDKAGWFTPGPTPGQKGPAVVAGHVTWNDRPSVFFKLGDLKKDQQIEITRADGRTARFTVERTVRYPKKDFPTVEVYKNLDHAGLRLITCGGAYSPTTRRYDDNVVVYARLTSVH
ncbi:class F sortase [Streptomyces sp. NPDC087440]|uniref:class F sortase n=1 Tax=Streptomyces sp. NPDC087440 TaxID=3365790 RepID=UPI00380583E9